MASSSLTSIHRIEALNRVPLPHHRNSQHFLRHTLFESFLLLHPVRLQECAYHRRYVGHIKAHTIEATRQTTRTGQPPQMTLPSCGERASPFPERPHSNSGGSQQCLTLGCRSSSPSARSMFGLEFFCLFVNIVLNLVLKARKKSSICFRVEAI